MSDRSPHIVVASIVERDGTYLVVEEMIEGRLMLNQPAGHWEPGESLFEGVCRETLEETAWDIEPTGFLGVYEWQAPHLPYTFVRFAFVGRPVRHHPDRALDVGIVRARWMTLAELRACAPMHRSPAVLACIDDYLAGRIFPLEVVRHLAP